MIVDEKKIFVSKADLIGECLSCGEPACGSFDCEDEMTTLVCVNCNSKLIFTNKNVEIKVRSWLGGIGELRS